jgi:hypothetical protein
MLTQGDAFFARLRRLERYQIRKEKHTPAMRLIKLFLPTLYPVGTGLDAVQVQGPEATRRPAFLEIGRPLRTGHGDSSRRQLWDAEWSGLIVH